MGYDYQSGEIVRTSVFLINRRYITKQTKIIHHLIANYSE
jgi:hypothetical protein